LAAEDAKRQLAEVAAEALEADLGDIVFRDRRVYVAGSPDRSLPFDKLVKMAQYSGTGKTILGRGYWAPEGIDPPVPPIGGACQAEIPKSIRMRVPNTEDDVIFQYKDAKWNPPIIQGAFTQPVPGGVVRRYVECKD